MTAVTGSFLLLQLLFLGNLSYLYGTQFQTTDRVHNFNVLFVDHDGGVVGQSVLAAYHLLKGSGFISVIQHPISDYPTVKDAREVVCKGTYWGAIYVNANASTSLAAALRNETAALAYESSGAVSLVWNGARYSTAAQAEVYMGMEALISASSS